MKYFQLLYAILLLPALYGCIKEDDTGCGEEDNSNVILHFNYTAADFEEEFLKRVQRVDLMIFSEEGNFLERNIIEKEELIQFQGAKLHLEPGIYHIIQWGNVSPNSRFTTLDSTTTMHTAKLFLNSEATADSLYYAPKKQTASATDFPLYRIEIPETGVVEKDIDFMSAYYTVNVYVKGFEDPIKGVTQAPTIAMTGAPEGYNFHLMPGDYRAKLRQTATLQRQEDFEIAQTSFHTPHFDVENPIEIDIIKRTTGLTEYTVNLQEILVANNYILRMGIHVNIDVYIEFQEDGKVEVTLTFPGWGTNPIEPD